MLVAAQLELAERSVLLVAVSVCADLMSRGITSLLVSPQGIVVNSSADCRCYKLRSGLSVSVLVVVLQGASCSPPSHGGQNGLQAA